MLKTSINASTFKANVLENISKAGLIIDTSEYSFFNKILNSLSLGLEDFVTFADSIVSKSSFDSDSNSSLDFIFSLFNIERKQLTYDTYSLDLLYTGSSIFTIKAGAYFFMDGSVYQNRYKYLVENDSRLMHVNLELLKLDSFEYTNLDVVDCGNFKISKNDLIYNTDALTFFSGLSGEFKLSSFNLRSESYETDGSYLARAKNLLQFMTSDTDFKIKSALLEIDGVSDIQITHKDFDTILTIIPTRIESIDSIIDYSYEIVDYYKTNNFVLKKPILNSIKVTNLLTQIDSSIHTEVTSFVENYIKELYYNKCLFNRNDFEFKLYEYIVTVFGNANFYKEKIEIIYKVYYECDETMLFSSGKIYSDNEKQFNVGLFVCEGVS